MSAAEPANVAIGSAQSSTASDPWHHVRLLHAVVLAVSLVILLLALVLEIREQSFVTLAGWTLPETCVWRTLFASDCPGCGMTRAFISLMHGDVAAAWHFNPVALPLFAFVALQIPYRAWQLRRLSSGRPEWTSRWQLYVPFLLLAVFFIRWLWWVSRFVTEAFR